MGGRQVRRWIEPLRSGCTVHNNAGAASRKCLRGRSIATGMGMTPVEGLLTGIRLDEQRNREAAAATEITGFIQIETPRKGKSGINRSSCFC